MAQSAPRPVDFYKVRVMWAGWTERQRNTLREEIEIAKDMVKGKAAQPEKSLAIFCVHSGCTGRQLVCCGSLPIHLLPCRRDDLAASLIDAMA